MEKSCSLRFCELPSAGGGDRRFFARWRSDAETRRPWPSAEFAGLCESWKDAVEAELSATGRPFVLGRGQADSSSRDRQGRGQGGRLSRGSARGHLPFSCLRAPLWTRQRTQVGVLRGPGVARPGRDGSREEWGGRWPRAGRAPRAGSVMSRAKGRCSSSSLSLGRRLPPALAHPPPRTMPTPGLWSPPRSPFLLSGPR
ncbi:hypothetical protein J1605_018334 [Eschrichtius robustus]|uniref:Uncharacterized protein n=1 Tax=Eschrichtius robustus TaxID=9764 RepID=A0AB34HY22_ESCRO|nr:hypothetical protein J1605_018334 [Eschrichtius robustus]